MPRKKPAHATALDDPDSSVVVYATKALDRVLAPTASDIWKELFVYVWRLPPSKLRIDFLGGKAIYLSCVPLKVPSEGLADGRRGELRKVNRSVNALRSSPGSVSRRGCELVGSAQSHSVELGEGREPIHDVG